MNYHLNYVSYAAEFKKSHMRDRLPHERLKLEHINDLCNDVLYNNEDTKI